MTREHRKSKQNRAKCKQRKNKARTVERMKNALKHLTVFYQNVNKIEGRLTNKKSR